MARDLAGSLANILAHKIERASDLQSGTIGTLEPSQWVCSGDPFGFLPYHFGRNRSCDHDDTTSEN
jgi:hypothetical protein